MNIDNDDEGEADEDDGAQYELNWMSLLNGCFIGTSGIKVLAVKVMSLLIAGVTLPDHKNITLWWFCAKTNDFILFVIPQIDEENELKCELWYVSVRSWKSAIHEIENVSDIPYHPLHWHEDKFWWIPEIEEKEKWAIYITQLQSKTWGGKVN